MIRSFVKQFIDQFERKERPSTRRDIVLGVSALPGSRQHMAIFPEPFLAQHLGIIGLSGSGKTHLIEP